MGLGAVLLFSEKRTLVSIAVYGNDLLILYCRFNADSPSRGVLESIAEPPGVGTSCMDDVLHISEVTLCLPSGDEDGFSTNYTVSEK